MRSLPRETNVNAQRTCRGQRIGSESAPDSRLPVCKGHIVRRRPSIVPNRGKTGSRSRGSGPGGVRWRLSLPDHPAVSTPSMPGLFRWACFAEAPSRRQWKSPGDSGPPRTPSRMPGMSVTDVREVLYDDIARRHSASTGTMAYYIDPETQQFLRYFSEKCRQGLVMSMVTGKNDAALCL